MSLVSISDRLYERLLRMKKEALLETMLEALDTMQAYNGRSITTCIMMALGAESHEDDDGNVRWVLPKKMNGDEPPEPPQLPELVSQLESEVHRIRKALGMTQDN